MLAMKRLMNCLDCSHLSYSQILSYLLMIEADVVLEIPFVDDREEGGWQTSIFCHCGRNLVRSRDCLGESY